MLDAEDVPDVVLHEMGHNVMYNVYGHIPDHDYGSDDIHYLMWNEEPGSAWVEGWADFWALLVTGNSTIYGKDLEAATWDYASSNPDPSEYTTQLGDTVEGRVAGALWDIYDSRNDNPYQGHSYDQINDNFTNIWAAFTSNETADTFADFWSILTGC